MWYLRRSARFLPQTWMMCTSESNWSFLSEREVRSFCICFIITISQLYSWKLKSTWDMWAVYFKRKRQVSEHDKSNISELKRQTNSLLISVKFLTCVAFEINDRVCWVLTGLRSFDVQARKSRERSNRLKRWVFIVRVSRARNATPCVYYRTEGGRRRESISRVNFCRVLYPWAAIIYLSHWR